MSDKKLAIPSGIPEIKFNLDTQEQFVKGRGIILEHWAAIPSPIGMKDKGEYRRPDSLDTMSSNGMIYKKIGEFTGVIVGNSKSHHDIDGGVMDNSTARLILPKTYDVCCYPDKTDISLLPGDRVYPKQIEVKVPNYQKMEYNPKGVDYAQFPISCVEFLIDSTGEEFKEGVHFTINKDGNVKWAAEKTPGIDPDTGKGRVYGIRYKYLAFWYVERLLNEVRITNTDTSNEPARMPYQAMICREYVFHNKNRGEAGEGNPVNTIDKRTAPEPTENIDPNKYQIKVNINNFE
jgi:hypothetical protein